LHHRSLTLHKTRPRDTATALANPYVRRTKRIAATQLIVLCLTRLLSHIAATNFS
jgi:hypothetical protein